jgi:hypothetical protein
MLVPKTSVDKYCFFDFWNYDVGLTRQFGMQSVFDFFCRQNFPDCDFGFGVFAFYSRHAKTSLLFG